MGDSSNFGMLRSAFCDEVMPIHEAAISFVLDLVLDAGVDLECVCTSDPVWSVGILTGVPVDVNFLGDICGVSVVSGPSLIVNFSMCW